MCGMHPPERYVFSLGFTIGAGLLAILLVINHMRHERFNPMRSEWISGCALSLSFCFALPCLSCCWVSFPV